MNVNRMKLHLVATMAMAAVAALAATGAELPAAAEKIQNMPFAPYEGSVTNLHVAGSNGNDYLTFDFVVHAAEGSEILCRMAMPPPGKWDGRLWGHGHGGYAGSVWNVPAPSGNARVVCDLGMGRATGHRAHAPTAMNEEEWKDFGWRATHLMTVFAKRFCTAYYGKAPHHSYFTGGSTGGGQAMHEAIRFPEDYDGVVAVVPAQGRTALEASLFHRYQMLTENGRPLLSTNQLQIVADAAVEFMKDRDEKYCAGKYLSDPRDCRRYEEEIFNLAAKKDPVFAKPDIRRRLHEIYEGKVIGGKRVANGYVYGARITHGPGHFSFATHLLGMPGAPSPKNATWDDFLSYVEKRAPDLDAMDPDLKRFAARGGKILSFVGFEDQTVPFPAALQHWEETAKMFGSVDKTRDFYRMYFLPGAAHGGIGRAMKSLPGYAGDYNKRLIDWVEKGISPEDIEITTNDGDKIKVAPYPDKAYRDDDGTWKRKPCSRLDRSDSMNGKTMHVTPGWENICPERQAREFPPVKVVWTAPMSGLDVRKEGGAEGEVSFENGMIRIRKTNAKGRITVNSPVFQVPKGKAIRLFADVSASAASPGKTGGYLCAHGEKRVVSPSDKIAVQWFAGGGYDYMRRLVNSAPGMTYRKYSHFMPETGAVTAVIAVDGEPSESVWSNWAAEDLDAAQEKWGEHWRRLAAPDRTAEMADEAQFDAAIAADRDHTAGIAVRDGVSRLLIDGIETPPIVYKVGSWNNAMYSGKPLQRHGIKVGCFSIRLGALPDSPGPWSKDGIDIKGLVSKIRRQMRLGDESVFILGLSTSAYPEFTAEHPDETWRRDDGSVVMGNSGSAIPDKYNDGGAPDPGDRRWPWVSYASPAWRNAIKDIVRQLAAELKRTGLSKRIVGVHFSGYHDGQFAMPVADHSPCAKAEYAKYLKENGLKAGDPGAEYNFFVRQLGFRALEDFSRAAKEAFGKPMVAVRWCMMPFAAHPSAACDINSFLHSDAVDVIVPQPTYTLRLPALAQGARLPCRTFHRYGKMMWFEFDLRTYAAMEKWARSVVASKGLGTSDDLPMWQTVYRKHAGIMTAKRMGWWFYDMAGGWYHPEEIAADCGKVYAFRRELDAIKPSPWRPDAAIVADERVLALYNTPDGMTVKGAGGMMMGQWPRLAVSGVPYDFVLGEEAYERPEVLKGYKAIALCAFLKPDARQKALMDKLDSWGIKTFVVQPNGYTPEFFNDFVKNAGGYVAVRPGGVQVDMNGDFISVHCIVPGCYDLTLPFPAKVVNVKSGLEENTAGGMLKLEMSAGETCWFRMTAID